MGSSSAGVDGSVFARVLLAPFRFILVLTLGLAGLLLVAWTVFWVSSDHLWPDGKQGMQNLLRAEIRAGHALVARQRGSMKALSVPANAMYGLVFGLSGVHAMGQRFAQRERLSIPDTVLRNAYVARQDYIEVAMVGTQLLGVRIGILGCYLPLLVVLYATGVIDGLSRRMVRRARVGRESASLYHRAKYLQVVILALGSFVVLVWPAPVAWGGCAGLAAMSIAGLAAVQWAFYKKHV